MEVMQVIGSLLHKKVIGNLEGIQCIDLTSDSRKVRSGSLFLALRGYTVDGHQFLKEVEERGVVAVVVEEVSPHVTIPQIVVPDTRKAAPILACHVFGNPTNKMRVIGVTGTNGKTTTTHLIDQILRDAGKLTGLIGTIKTRIGTEEFEMNNTTPESIDLQRIFNQMYEVGTEYPIMEVSSHALELGRVAGVEFHTAIFTNLTQDHLDYHKTMEEYRAAKAKLFSRLGNIYSTSYQEGPIAVLNADDSASEFFQSQTVAQILTYGIDHPADVRAEAVQIESSGASFWMRSPFGSRYVKLQMTGKFSVYNALAATAACLLEGVSLEAICCTLESISGVNGRFESVQAGQKFQVIVDYAHTPDSLENVLLTIREFAKGKVVTVVGCGGDRDRSKRPIMAEIAARYSDFTIITSDNPRTEDPESILDEMEQGLLHAPSHSYLRITDRKEAIQFAVNSREEQDVVLIAGKGHETYQMIGKTKYDFDDRKMAIEAIRGSL